MFSFSSAYFMSDILILCEYSADCIMARQIPEETGTDLAPSFYQSLLTTDCDKLGIYCFISGNSLEISA